MDKAPDRSASRRALLKLAGRAAVGVFAVTRLVRTAWAEARGSFEKIRQALDEASSAISKHAQNIEAATR